MQSKGKARQTALEKRWVSLLAEQPCVVCGADGVEIHEFEQGQWFTAVPLCARHHRHEVDGWHGQRLAWKLARIDKDQAINLAVGRAFEALRL
jgi:hypothetical protein